MATYPEAAKSTVVSAGTGTTGSSFSTIGLLNDARLRRDADMIDVSVFSSSGWKDFVMGLKSGTISVSGVYAGTSDAGFAVINDSYNNDSACYIRYLHDGSTGFQSQVKVSSLEVNGGVNGAVEFSAEMQITGKVTATT